MRSFVAIDIPANENIIRIIRMMSEKGVKVKTVEKENIHLTLKFLGEIDDAQKKEISDFLTYFESYTPFKIYLKGVGAFPSISKARTIWIGVEYPKILEKMWVAIEDLSEKIGINREKRGFSPHVTIGRVKDLRNAWKLRDFLMEHKNDVVGSVYVEEIKLKRSVLTPSGPIYSDIASVKLRG